MSAKQLIGKDPSPTLVTRLANPASPEGRNIEYLSISGGLRRLSFGLGKPRDMLANLYLQANLAAPNDGLVAEISSDLSGQRFNACAPGCSHASDYAEYEFTNHSFLVENQTVAMTAVAFAR